VIVRRPLIARRGGVGIHGVHPRKQLTRFGAQTSGRRSRKSKERREGNRKSRNQYGTRTLRSGPAEANRGVSDSSSRRTARDAAPSCSVSRNGLESPQLRGGAFHEPIRTTHGGCCGSALTRLSTERLLAVRAKPSARRASDRAWHTLSTYSRPWPDLGRIILVDEENDYIVQTARRRIPLLGARSCRLVQRTHGQRWGFLCCTAPPPRRWRAFENNGTLPDRDAA